MPVFKRSYDDTYFRTANILFFRRNDVRAMAELILSHRRGGELLEIGCGDGMLSGALRNHFKITCSDISESALHMAERYIKRQNLQILDIDHDNIKGAYDVIIALNVLEHLKNPVTALRRIRMSLKDNGFFIFSAPNNYGPYGTIATGIMNYFDKTHISTLKRGQWLELFKQEGFEIADLINGTFLGYIRNEAGKYFASTIIVVLRPDASLHPDLPVKAGSRGG